MKRLKTVALISGILTLLQLIPIVGSRILTAGYLLRDMRESGAIGVIGGADGPTAIYVAAKITDFPISAIIRCVFFAACVLAFLVSVVLLIKNKSNK